MKSYSFGNFIMMHENSNQWHLRKIVIIIKVIIRALEINQENSSKHNIFCYIFVIHIYRNFTKTCIFY